MSSRSTSRKPEGRGERVQKVLAATGFASRREVDRLIQSGRVVIDGRTAVPGERLTGRERVYVDGNRIRITAAAAATEQSPEILLYHKPVGEVTTRRDSGGRKSVFDALPRSKQGRWVEAGQLDFRASGLLLLTTDGALAERISRAGGHIEQGFALRIRGELSGAALQEQISAEHRGAIVSVTDVGGGRANRWYELRVRKGGSAELRRWLDQAGATVNRLIRVSFGPLELGRLARGRSRLVAEDERRMLLDAIAESRAGKP